MAKYSKKAGDKIGDVMHEYKEGKLKSGSGDKVKSRKQAIAIGISEARDKNLKVPDQKSSGKASSKKSSSSKSSGETKSTASKKSSTSKKSSASKKSGGAKKSNASKKSSASKKS